MSKRSYNIPDHKRSYKRIRLKEDEVKIVEDYRKTREDILSAGGNIEDVKMMWLKTKHGSYRIDNPLYKDDKIKFIDYVESRLEEVLSSFEGKLPLRKLDSSGGGSIKFLKATTTDDHVGLDCATGDEIFSYEYNADIYEKSVEKLYNSIMNAYKVHGKFDVLYLENLGDEQDGWNGFTTRGGHELDQNMSNIEVFDAVVDTKVNLLINLFESNVANKIVLRKVVNDNHSGDFGYVCNKAIGKILTALYGKGVIEVDSLEKFLEHRYIGDHCFIYTHGKDAKHRTRPLPLILDAKTIAFIDDYIRHHGIDRKAKYIHLEKGDLHQLGYQRTNLFEYKNFMSFAPPSIYVQNNFGDSVSGYTLQVMEYHSNEYDISHKYLDYKRK